MNNFFAYLSTTTKYYVAVGILEIKNWKYLLFVKYIVIGKVGNTKMRIKTF